MTRMDTVLTGAGSFASELVGLVRDLRIGLRAQMERTFPDVPFGAEPVVHWLRVKDDVSFAAAVTDAREAAACIGPAGQRICEVIDALDVEVARIKGEIARTGFERWRESGGSWNCEEITVRRREAQFHMQQVFAHAATLHYAMQRTLWNIEFIHECPPHPCDDLGTSTEQYWYARRYDAAGRGYGDDDRLKVAQDARAAAEQAARDAEAEWKVQSERAAEAEAQRRQEREARWAAERALREIEARAKQAEQGRAEAERLAEDAERNRAAAETRVTELEERMRQRERERDAESDGTGDSQRTARAASPRATGSRRGRRNRSAES